MATNVPIVPEQPQASAYATAPETADLDQRWVAWQAIGAARDRAFRQNMAVVATMIIVAAVIIYALLGR